MNTPDIGILQQQAVELKLGLDHWRENAYRASDRCEELKAALKALLEDSQERSRQRCADHACEYFPTDAEQQAIEALNS